MKYHLLRHISFYMQQHDHVGLLMRMTTVTLFLYDGLQTYNHCGIRLQYKPVQTPSHPVFLPFQF